MGNSAEMLNFLCIMKIAPAEWPKCKILISELMTPSGGLGHVLQKEKIAFNQAQI